MTIKQLKPGDNFKCEFELAKNGKMGHCGEPAVTISSKKPLCKEHTHWLASMNNCTLKNSKGHEVTETKRFFELIAKNNG